MRKVELTQLQVMLLNEIKTDGISIDDMSDEDLIDKALTGEDINGIEEEETETLPEAKSEEKTEEEETPASQGEEEKSPSGEKELPPFHEHPRFKEIIQQNQELKKFKEETEIKLAALEKPKEVIQQQIPVWFAGDEEDWDGYQRDLADREKNIINNTLEAINKKQEEQSKALQQMDIWVDEQIVSLQADPEVDAFKKNELLKVILDYKPTDDNGNLDFKKGYKIMRALQLQQGKPLDNTKQIIKKKVASATIDSGSGGSEETSVVTANDIRHKSFSQLLN